MDWRSRIRGSAQRRHGSRRTALSAAATSTEESSAQRVLAGSWLNSAPLRPAWLLSTVTDAMGDYALTSVPAGTFDLAIIPSAAFEPLVCQDIDTTAVTSQRIDATLAGATTTTIGGEHAMATDTRLRRRASRWSRAPAAR